MPFSFSQVFCKFILIYFKLFFRMADLEDDLDYAEIFNGITKEQVGASLHHYIIEPYEAIFDSDTKKAGFIKPSEYMKAWEMITKLKGFDKEAGEDLPDEIELKL